MFQRQCVVDGRLREVVEECAALSGYDIFKYYDEEGDIKDVKSRELNAYITKVMGSEFSPKDFRTWVGTLVAAVKLAELGATDDLKAAEKNVVAAIDAVAEPLGNTRAIARSSYVSPRVIDHYMEGPVISYYCERIEIIVAEQGDLTEDEKALLELLQKKLRRELEKAA